MKFKSLIVKMKVLKWWFT